MTVSQTMMVAQRLYEAGHITYMRTDSLNLSSMAMNAIAAEITGSLGERYAHARHFHTSSKGAQEAHEAIRPTYINKTTVDGTDREKRLYALIWKRAVASQMADAELEKTTVTVRIAGDSERQEHFNIQGQVVKFDGFMRVYASKTPLQSDSESDDSADETLLPPMKTGDTMKPEDITATESFRRQPPRYDEGTLVKKLEELGIGRRLPTRRQSPPYSSVNMSRKARNRE